MKTLNQLFDKEPKYLNIYFDTEKSKLVVLKSNFCDNLNIIEHKNLNVVFTLTPYLIGMLQTLKIPFYKAKNRILNAINKDLKKGNPFNKNSNLYNVLVNEFGISIRT